MAANEGYVIAAYLVTAAALGGYAWRLFARARDARGRADAIAARRRAS
jgi:hypothetical protein